MRVLLLAVALPLLVVIQLSQAYGLPLNEGTNPKGNIHLMKRMEAHEKSPTDSNQHTSYNRIQEDIAINVADQDPFAYVRKKGKNGRPAKKVTWEDLENGQKTHCVQAPPTQYDRSDIPGRVETERITKVPKCTPRQCCCVAGAIVGCYLLSGLSYAAYKIATAEGGAPSNGYQGSQPYQQFHG